MVKIAVIGLPNKWSTETLADAVKAKTGFRLIIDMNEVIFDLKKQTLFYKNHDLSKLDAIIVKKISPYYNPNTLDKLELLRVLENQGVKIFSPAENILKLINRLSCTVTLANANIPMPETKVTEDISEAIATVEEFEEAVFKPLYSTKARGMCVIKKTNPKKVKQEILKFQAQNPMMYIQKKLALGGQDLGLVFLGGKYLGAYARISKGNSWNTTINSGGHYAAAQPSEEIIEMATKAQGLFNMDFTTVDVAITKDEAFIFEVSAFGGFKGAKEGIGINAAKLYVDYVICKLNE